MTRDGMCGVFIPDRVLAGWWRSHLPMKMELIEGSETSAISIVTPGNYPKENILHTGSLFIF